MVSRARLCYNIAMEKMMIAAALAVLAVTNAVSFCLMAHDKWCAVRGRWRVPERMLLLSAACFGGLGGVLGMRLLRHKTRHRRFRVLLPVFLALQIALLSAGAYWLLGRAG